MIDQQRIGTSNPGLYPMQEYMHANHYPEAKLRYLLIRFSKYASDCQSLHIPWSLIAQSLICVSVSFLSLRDLPLSQHVMFALAC